MKRRDVLACVVYLVPIFSLAQGTSCSTPIPIPMDGVSRSYTISSSTGGSLVCTSNGTTPITYFSITSNGSAQNMMLRISSAVSQWIEVGFYDGTSCTNANFEAASSICFYDGKGIWAPAANFVITPNSTYILRLKTALTGTIQIAGQYYTPPNNSCLTATPLGSELLLDNNASHKPATDITPSNVCSPVLENTAFYVYTVETTGNSSISIESMECDNNYQSNGLNLGYKVGLMTGNCGALTTVGCYLGVFAGVQVNAGALPAGTKVYVAIDGILGTNCDYAIRAINAVILSATLRHFIVWKTATENILKWVSMNETENAFFDIERSTDGVNFRPAGRLAGQGNSSSDKEYEFVDHSPPVKGFYRLKMISANGKYSYSNVIRVDRKSNLNSKVRFNNIVSDKLSLQINDLAQQKISFSIIDRSGREIYHQNARINSGLNLINIPTRQVSSGLYYLVITGDDYREAFTFLKN